jgi:hypothetical protein
VIQGIILHIRIEINVITIADGIGLHEPAKARVISSGLEMVKADLR